MEKHGRFLGICILIAALMISISTAFSALADRYTNYAEGGMYTTFDKLTGNIMVYRNDRELYTDIFYEMNQLRMREFENR